MQKLFYQNSDDSGYSKIPEDQATFGVQNFNGVDMFFIATGNLNIPNETKIRAGKFGIRVNTNQEFVYRLAHDFSHFVEHALANDMFLSFNTIKLSIDSGIRNIHADSQNLEVSVVHKSDWSTITIKLDSKFRRVPRWIPDHPVWETVPPNPGNYPGYDSENPFCFRTLKEVLGKLVSDADAYLPPYYTVTYKKPSENTGYAQHDSGIFAEVVVPLKFTLKTEGRHIKQEGFSNGIAIIEIAVQHPEGTKNDTTARIGSYGINIEGEHDQVVAHEISNLRGPEWVVPERFKSSYYAQFDHINGKGWQFPMWIRMDTPVKLPVREGIYNLIADGQKLSLRVWHLPSSSHVVISLPDTFQRSPHYWWDFWGGANNPGNYPGYEVEEPFCGRTVREVFRELAPEFDSFLPEWYQVNYADGLTLESLKPDIDFSFQSDVDMPTFIIPFYKYTRKDTQD